MRWYVLDMDEGVLHHEPTRAAAVQWWIGHTGGRVLSRHNYGPGSYEYRVGFGTDDAATVFIEREDRARSGGWDLTQRPAY